MKNAETIKALFIIVNAGFSNDAIDIARECGAPGATVLSARGTGQQYHNTFLGVNIESEKEMIISLVSETVAEKIMDAIQQRTGVQTPALGICFCMPVDKMTLINKQS